MAGLKRLWAIALAGVVAAAPAWAAEPYPSRPITITVPVPAGGTADFLIRTLADRTAERTGETLIIKYQPGASAVIASQAVAKAAPDGYTVLMAYTSHAINPYSNASLPYDSKRDFTPITLLGKLAMVMVSSTEVPAKNLEEFIAYAKANPDAVTFGSSGLGGAGHLGTELASMQGGFPIRTVPYKGGSEAIVDLMGGRISMMTDSYSVFEPHLDSGKIRVLAVTSESRQAFRPDLPAVSESIPGYEAVAWWGLLAPAGVPDESVQWLQKEFATTIAEPNIRKRLMDRGWEPVGSTTEFFTKFIEAENKKWEPVVKQVGFSVGR